MPDEEIEDLADFRAALGDLMDAAEAAEISSDAMTGLLTAHLAGVRGSVRLPLSMPPERARAFTDNCRANVGETMQVELLVSEAVIDDLELQLQVFEGQADEQE